MKIIRPVILVLLMSLGCLSCSSDKNNASKNADNVEGYTNQVQNPNLPEQWEIMTYNFKTSESTSYDVNSYPEGAGTLPNEGVWFNFPKYKDADEAVKSENVIRVWKVYGQPQSLITYKNLEVSLTVQISDGTPEFFWQTEAVNTCQLAVSTRPVFIARYDYIYRSAGTDEWWSHQSYSLAPGSAILDTPLTLDQWSMWTNFSNYDEQKLAGFKYSLENTHAIGLSFGGGCFLGHGVSTIGGTARFEVSFLKETQ
jgi:hypothetical protein